MRSKYLLDPQSLQRPQYHPRLAGGLRLQQRLFLKAIMIVSISLFVASCTRTTVSLLPTTTAAAEIPQVNPTPFVISTFEPSGMYAVVGIPEEDVLFLRNPAGITGSIVEELAYDERGITATGNVANLGSSIWMEIQTPDGSRGWVNSLNMTEDVSQEQFCQDARALMVLDTSLRSIQTQDGDLLFKIINPRRGLTIRHDWWNPEVIIPADSLSGIFEDRNEEEWGLMSGGEFKIQGSFKDIILPLLENAISNSPAVVCADVPSGTTSREVFWPTEYTSLNYFSIHRPAPEGGNAFDWRTWAFVFEYIDGEPFLTSIIHFHGDV